MNGMQGKEKREGEHEEQRGAKREVCSATAIDKSDRSNGCVSALGEVSLLPTERDK